MSLDGFSLSALVQELNNALRGGRIDKIFQPDKNTLLLWVRQPGINHRLLISVNPEHPHLCLTDKAPENPAAAPSFCMLLRKHLEDGRIVEISQHNLDRVMFLKVDVRGERGLITTKQLNIELMGKHSNIIFTENNIIIDAIKRIGPEISRVRSVLPHKEYVYPPGQPKLNILSAASQDLIDFLQKFTPYPLTKALINAYDGIGPLTAKEIAWRAGLPFDITIETLDAADFQSILSAIGSLSPLTITPTVCVGTEGQGNAIAAFPFLHLSQHQTETFPTMSQAVEYFDGLKGGRRLPEKDILYKFVTAETNKLHRKQGLIAKDLETAENADILRRFADLIMANLHNIPHGSSAVTVPDLFSLEAGELTIELDPLLPPVKNAQNYYTKFNKQKRARETLMEQLRHCIEDINYMESISIAIQHASCMDDLAEIREELSAAGYLKANKKRLTTKSTPHKFLSPDGLVILVGKNNRQNDFLTFKQSHPDDIWLHTKDIPGSHVILRTGPAEPSCEDLRTAALLSAYFSKARASSNVPVDYTRRRYVKKPAGAKPGFVIYERQNTLYVTPDTEALKPLLNSNTAT